MSNIDDAKRILIEIQRAIIQIQAKLDQIRARLRDEGGDPTLEEWVDLKELLGGSRDLDTPT